MRKNWKNHFPPTPRPPEGGGGGSRVKKSEKKKFFFHKNFFFWFFFDPRPLGPRSLEKWVFLVFAQKLKNPSPPPTPRPPEGGSRVIKSEKKNFKTIFLTLNPWVLGGPRGRGKCFFFSFLCKKLENSFSRTLGPQGSRVKKIKKMRNFHFRFFDRRPPSGATPRGRGNYFFEFFMQIFKQIAYGDLAKWHRELVYVSIQIASKGKWVCEALSCSISVQKAYRSQAQLNGVELLLRENSDGGHWPRIEREHALQRLSFCAKN